MASPLGEVVEDAVSNLFAISEQATERFSILQRNSLSSPTERSPTFVSSGKPKYGR